MDNAALATQKQDVLTGSHVNYYLQNIPNPDGSVTTVECEDIMEYFNMSFAAGTVFKSVWRNCKLRQDLGKPGSSAEYEIGKIFYYSERTRAVSLRRLRAFEHLSLQNHKEVTIEGGILSLIETVSIPDPKRLTPYTFKTSDLLRALGCTELEAVVMREVLLVCVLRRDHILPVEEDKRASFLYRAAANLKDSFNSQKSA